MAKGTLSYSERSAARSHASRQLPSPAEKGSAQIYSAFLVPPSNKKSVKARDGLAIPRSPFSRCSPPRSPDPFPSGGKGTKHVLRLCCQQPRANTSCIRRLLKRQLRPIQKVGKGKTSLLPTHPLPSGPILARSTSVFKMLRTGAKLQGGRERSGAEKRRAKRKRSSHRGSISFARLRTPQSLTHFPRCARISTHWEGWFLLLFRNRTLAAFTQKGLSRESGRSARSPAGL